LIDIFKRAYILEAARTTERQFVDSWSRENLFYVLPILIFPQGNIFTQEEMAFAKNISRT